MPATSSLRDAFSGLFSRQVGVWDHAAWVLLALVLVWFAVEGALEPQLHPLRPGSLDDYAQALMLSREVLATTAYPPAFTYPLPGVLLRVALGRLGLELSGVMWIAAMLAAIYATLGGLRGMTPPALRGFGGRRALLALLVSVYFVQWDFRAVNSNLIFLGLVVGGLSALRRERIWLGSLLLAASVALKLYSVLLLPWLLGKGRWRDVLACMAWLLLLFVVLPLLWLGPAEAWNLTGSWLAVIADSGSADFPLRYHGYHTSLHSLLVAFLHGGDGRVNPLTDLKLNTILRLNRALTLAWLLGVTGVLAWRRRAPWPSTRGAQELLEPALILVLALAVSPMMQPAHGAVLLLPAWLLLGVALDARPSRLRRGVGAAVPLITALILALCPAGPWKALGVQLGLVLWALGLGALASPQEHGAS